MTRIRLGAGLMFEIGVTQHIVGLRPLLQVLVHVLDAFLAVSVLELAIASEAEAVAWISFKPPDTRWNRVPLFFAIVVNRRRFCMPENARARQGSGPVPFTRWCNIGKDEFLLRIIKLFMQRRMARNT
jgi:hypothetical protein